MCLATGPRAQGAGVTRGEEAHVAGEKDVVCGVGEVEVGLAVAVGVAAAAVSERRTAVAEGLGLEEAGDDCS